MRLYAIASRFHLGHASWGAYTSFWAESNTCKTFSSWWSFGLILSRSNVDAVEYINMGFKLHSAYAFSDETSSHRINYTDTASPQYHPSSLDRLYERPMTVRCGSIPLLSAILLLLFLREPTTLQPVNNNMPPKPKLNVHSFPRPPLLEKTPRHIQVKWRGQTIADTKDAYWVLETTHPPSKPFACPHAT